MRLNFVLMLLATTILSVGCNKKTPYTESDFTKDPNTQLNSAPKLESITTISTSMSYVSSKCFISDDGQQVVLDGQISTPPVFEVWETKGTPKKILSQQGTLKDVSSDGKRLAYSSDKGLQIVETSTNKSISKVTIKAYSDVRFVGNDKVLLSIDAKGEGSKEFDVRRITVLNISSGETLLTFDIPAPNKKASDGRFLGLVNNDKELAIGWPSHYRFEVWNLSTGKLIRGTNVASDQPKVGWSDIGISPDGLQASVRFRTDDPHTVYDLENGQELEKFKGYYFAFHPQKNRVLVGHLELIDAKKSIWVVKEFGKSEPLASFGDSLSQVSLSKNGKFAATYARESSTKRWIVWDMNKLP